MAWIIDFFFLVFGLIRRAGAGYWRYFLLALLSQLIGQWVPHAWDAWSITWLLQWIVPLYLLLMGMKNDQSLSLSSRVIFFALWIIGLGLSFWDHPSLVYKRGISGEPAFLPKHETVIYEGKASLDESKPEKGVQDDLISDEWQPLTSSEGRFRVLSPLPAKTQVSYKKIGGAEVKFTQTKVKDLDECTRYVVITTHYTDQFRKPADHEQAKLALDHLLQSYQFDQLPEVQAVVQKDLNALVFHAASSQSKEHLYGMILPTSSILYQVLIFSCDEKVTLDKAEKFMTSFEPLIATTRD